MSDFPSPINNAAEQILSQLEEILLDAERQTKPLEMPPYRAQIFELFAAAVSTGLVHEDAQPDLTSDGVLKSIAERWGLGDKTRQSVSQQTKMSPEDVNRLRLLWSLLRMWMEWTYAWERWPDFHGQCSHDHTAGSH